MGRAIITMTQYVAFLRAINVGGHNVKMARLRELFEALGLSDVETFIASGNVIFGSADDARGLEVSIERHLKGELGYEVATFVRSMSDLTKVAAYQPFAAGGGSLYIAFLKASPSSAAQRELFNHRSRVNDFRVHGREIYWQCRTRISDSAFSGAILEKTVGMPATLRNANTVTRLVNKYAD